jgi:hypothetical protein
LGDGVTMLVLQPKVAGWAETTERAA